MKAKADSPSFTGALGAEGDHVGPGERVKISCCTRIAAGRLHCPLGVFGLGPTASASPKKPKEPIRIYGESVCNTT